MTPEQALFQLSDRMTTLTDRAGSTVFGDRGVVIADDFPQEQLSRLPAPSLVIKPGAEAMDPEAPLLSATFDIECLLFVERMAEQAGRSGIRDSMRLQDLIVAETMNVKNMAGVRCVCTRKSPFLPVPFGNRPLSYRAFTIQARSVGRFSESDRLPPATSATATPGAGSAATISWTRPPYYSTRYDYLGVIVRSSTSAYPSSVTDGTSEQTATDNASVAVTRSSGANYYSIFVAYDTNGDGAADEYSSAAQISSTYTP